MSSRECQACWDRKDPRVEKVQKGRSVIGDHQECRVPGETEDAKGLLGRADHQEFGNKRGTCTCANERRARHCEKSRKKRRQRRERRKRQSKSSKCSITNQLEPMCVKIRQRY